MVAHTHTQIETSKNTWRCCLCVTLRSCLFLPFNQYWTELSWAELSDSSRLSLLLLLLLLFLFSSFCRLNWTVNCAQWKRRRRRRRRYGTLTCLSIVSLFPLSVRHATPRHTRNRGTIMTLPFSLLLLLLLLLSWEHTARVYTQRRREEGEGEESSGNRPDRRAEISRPPQSALCLSSKQQPPTSSSSSSSPRCPLLDFCFLLGLGLGSWLNLVTPKRVR